MEMIYELHLRRDERKGRATGMAQGVQALTAKLVPRTHMVRGELTP